MTENFQTLTRFREIGNKENINDYLLLIYGQLNQEIIISAIKLAENKLIYENFPKNIITKMKTITAEILQNVVKHQVKHETLKPYFIIGLNDRTLKIISGNIISTESKKIITDNLDKFIHIENNKLRNFYIETFKEAEVLPNGNAGLGLLDIVYRSNQQVKYKIEPVSNGLFSFDLTVMIGSDSSKSLNFQK